MTISEISKEKNKRKTSALRQYKLRGRTKPLIFVDISEVEILNALLPALASRKSNFIIHVTSDEVVRKKFDNVAYYTSEDFSDEIFGSDAVIADDVFSSIEAFGKNMIIPLIPTNNYLSCLLKPYNPLDASGEAIYYEGNNIWDIFAAIVRFEENFSFVHDRRTMQRNICKLFAVK